jgi:hypothetical protein
MHMQNDHTSPPSAIFNIMARGAMREEFAKTAPYMDIIKTATSPTSKNEYRDVGDVAVDIHSDVGDSKPSYWD